MKGVGVLADVTAKEPKREYLTNNLIYGFNGSGKSTLSRIFSCLQAGTLHDGLPENCAFEIEMQDGKILASPNKLAGFEDKVCVFNEDFIEQNLRWSEGTANSIFYISQAQADLAKEMKDVESKIPERSAALAAEKKIEAEREKTLRTYKTERAKTIAAALHSANRRFEAGQLQKAYDEHPYSEKSVLDAEGLETATATARRSERPPALQPIIIGYMGVKGVIDGARYYGDVSIGTVMLEELERHPSMASWLMHGEEYHSANKLSDCLFCGNPLTVERKEKLAAAFDGRLAKLADELEGAETQIRQVMGEVDTARSNHPRVAEITLALRGAYTDALRELNDVADEAWALLNLAHATIRQRRAEPTKLVPNEIIDEAGTVSIATRLEKALAAANDLIAKHNEEAVDFEKVQTTAREAILAHYLAEGDAEFRRHEKAVRDAQDNVAKIDTEMVDLKAKVAELRAKVRENGPPAEKITKLIHAYLGHGELSIVVAEGEGYELHRHGKLVKGPPSEGEKTAIALCYFLTTLESEGRAIKDLVVVVDDPISSLDTKAMNYACALIRSRLAKAKQVIVLTHNQHCMNEFKKAWKGQAYPRNATTKPSATLSYIDVKMVEATDQRRAKVVEMSHLLREYDSEYHFLCQKLLEFEAAGQAFFEYHFMMPNIMRRVMEIFLAFKVPGTDAVQSKLASLCEDYKDEIDGPRIVALERLVQVESHSDNLDDLIGHSSMTIEETRDANAALLLLMRVADARHEKAIRRHCKAA